MIATYNITIGGVSASHFSNVFRSSPSEGIVMTRVAKRLTAMIALVSMLGLGLLPWSKRILGAFGIDIHRINVVGSAE